MLRHRILPFFGLWLAVAASALYARPQLPSAAAPPPSVLAEIHAAGSSRYSEARIVAAVGLQPGEAITRDRIQAAVDRLLQLGVFSRVNYTFTSRGDQITLNLVLEDAPQVPVEFDNFPWFSDEELKSAIREAAPLFDQAAPTGGAQLDQMIAAIGRLMEARGVPGTVARELVAQPWSNGQSNGMMLQFRAEGVDVTLDSLDYGSVLAAGSERLRDRQRDLLQKPFSRVAIKLFEREQIQPIYLSAGHLRVQFGEPQVRVTGRPSQSSGPNQSVEKVSVALRIVPGPVFHFTDVGWTGATVLPDATLRQLLVLKPGDVADGLAISAGLLRIEAEYKHRGYLDVKLELQPRFDDAAATVSYQVAVTEGPQYRMGELILTGLSLDAARSLREKWTLQKGTVFDGDYLLNMLDKLAKPNTEIFGSLPVHYMEMGHWLRTDPQTRTADVLIDFK